MNDVQVKTPEDRLKELGVHLPEGPPEPIGAFTNVRRAGDLLYVSGQGPVEADGTLHVGKVGDDVTAEAAQEHAQLVAVNILAALKAHCGELSRVTGVVKLLGLVNAHPDFERHPFVIDGASNLLAKAFGEAGVHSRSAFGVSSLPRRITVEIEAIFEIDS
ncbi:Enamine deaminase RidA, house cleaning of reactive enamine intermediates, YjgF/YER057c/UK114 family [Palleronia marisminoris]|uniref:Endoribonuclease L-PSP n=1 Tax=Palleronia marisminoris TaxID=315423 RepID=A0A1Y5S385_9RHOB|nr:RidA family protein [Palleronia marisminoris]SFG62494.1 Enamine deaminase RidA, house cleaning of reactive enamine intermediates, YjgF/YER057c/UK114 family [Palleronia marisminoris]SLN31651.1 Endoribonuclease L-PSP [Palleronia marisminoris]